MGRISPSGFLIRSVLSGLGQTLLLTLLGTLFSIIFGTALALARLSKSYLLNSLAWGYIWLFRSLPLLLVLIILYNFSYLYDNLSLGIPFTSLSFFSTPTVDLLDQFPSQCLAFLWCNPRTPLKSFAGGF
jgi:polar amino acid transport system permease protein